jgi:polyferredoxin
VLAVVLTGFYTLVYWWPVHLEGLVRQLDPLAMALARQPAHEWFLYGLWYTLAVGIMGARMALRHRGNPYQTWRTASVVFFQLAFGFVIPQVLRAFQQPEFYFTYFWPLKKEYLFPTDLAGLVASGGLGVFMAVWGVGAALVATPVLTWAYGKRWYCSWVCGCGGLAETAGDPFRHLSDKSRAAWRFERWSIHLTLVAVTAVTVLVFGNHFVGGAWLGAASGAATRTYGFVVGAVLSGVVGVGFYPLLGSRIWCRYFCPQAAILGIIQRFFSRFRITTNGGQCISCGNCSTYCEMGIDVRAYAQRGENIVRASCVGCGLCAAVCPRGVLKLENGPVGDRFPAMRSTGKLGP